ncbi:MAG: YebC/PmpR family DNA-binding transcriptional regulator, partial [Culicoidibacterales bacterium]
SYTAIRYEGYGIGGTAVIVDALTDNVNRTVAEVRTAFNKNGGNMGVSGAVSFLFQPTALYGVKDKTEEELLEIMIEGDCDIRDIELQEDIAYIYANTDQFAKVGDALRTAGITEFEVAELTEIPLNEVVLSEADAVVFEKMIDILEDLDDVQNVYHNVEM